MWCVSVVNNLEQSHRVTESPMRSLVEPISVEYSKMFSDQTRKTASGMYIIYKSLVVVWLLGKYPPNVEMHMYITMLLQQQWQQTIKQKRSIIVHKRLIVISFSRIFEKKKFPTSNQLFKRIAPDQFHHTRDTYLQTRTSRSSLLLCIYRTKTHQLPDPQDEAHFD